MIDSFILFNYSLIHSSWIHSFCSVNSQKLKLRFIVGSFIYHSLIHWFIHHWFIHFVRSILKSWIWDLTPLFHPISMKILHFQTFATIFHAFPLVFLHFQRIFHPFQRNHMFFHWFSYISHSFPTNFQLIFHALHPRTIPLKPHAPPCTPMHPQIFPSWPSAGGGRHSHALDPPSQKAPQEILLSNCKFDFPFGLQKSCNAPKLQLDDWAVANLDASLS